MGKCKVSLEPTIDGEMVQCAVDWVSLQGSSDDFEAAVGKVYFVSFRCTVMDRFSFQEGNFVFLLKSYAFQACIG